MSSDRQAGLPVFTCWPATLGLASQDSAAADRGTSRHGSKRTAPQKLRQAAKPLGLAGAFAEATRDGDPATPVRRVISGNGMAHRQRLRERCLYLISTGLFPSARVGVGHAPDQPATIGHRRQEANFEEGLARARTTTPRTAIVGRWGGKGAERLGLAGEVRRDAFLSLCGQTGDPELRDGPLNAPVEARPATVRVRPLNFHAPKSVSASSTR